MAELDLYPFSSPDGTPIPLDIIRPLGLIKQDFTSVASAAVNIPATAEILVFTATQECLIQLDGVAALPDNGVHTEGLFALPANTAFIIDHNESTTFTVIALGAEGTLYVMTATKYKDVRKPAQFTRS